MAEPLFNPVSGLGTRAEELVARVKADHIPVVLTEDGRSTAVLLDAETYEAMRYRIALHDAIDRGQRDVAAGRVIPHEEVRKRLTGWRERK